MSATNPRPTCNENQNSDDRATCTHDTHVRAHDRDAAPTTTTARAAHERAQAIAGVLSGDWGATTGREITLAAPTKEVVCPIHGVVHKEY